MQSKFAFLTEKQKKILTALVAVRIPCVQTNELSEAEVSEVFLSDLVLEFLEFKFGEDFQKDFSGLMEQLSDFSQPYDENLLLGLGSYPIDPMIIEDESNLEGEEDADN
jgi:hypothetical protein